MKPMKLNAGKNWLWLWILPAALSWLLVSLTRPTGGAAFWAELAIICSCSCLAGFALAFKSFSIFKGRLCGGLFFTGASLSVLSSVVFIGCAYDTTSPRPLTPRQIVERENQTKARVAKLIRPRDAQADQTMLDLTSFYDVLLPGQAGRNPAGFRASDPGTHTWNGTKFDVRGMIQSQYQPDRKITGIPVGQKCSGIVFLHGEALWFHPTNTFTRLVVHFANGVAETLPLIFGKDVAASYINYNPPALNLAMTNPVVWQETIPVNGTSRPAFVFYMTEWTNPFPGQTVTTVDMVPSQGNADPFLVAITIHPVNP